MRLHLTLATLIALLIVLAASPALAQWNRAPHAPTLVAPAHNARLAASSLQPTYQLHWRNNGDPDGDRLGFYLETFYWDVYTRSWKPLLKRSVAGTSTPMSFKGSPGSSLHIAWRVQSVDWAKRSRPWYAASGWRVFFVSFPAKQSTPGPQPQPGPTGGFDFGHTWDVWGYHVGSAKLNRVQGSSNRFNAYWKGRWCMIQSGQKCGMMRALRPFARG